MDDYQDLKSDKIIIIGFTGPIGSGCTEISKFLSDYEGELKKFFEESGYVELSEKQKIKPNLFDTKLETEFKKKSNIEKQIEYLHNEIDKSQNIDLLPSLEINKRKAKLIHKNIKTLLEERKYLYSLECLFDQNYYKNKLRISCSSIIVFELVRRLNEAITGGNKKRVQEFRSLIKAAIKKHHINIGIFDEVFSSIENLFLHRQDIEKIKPDLMPECFDSVAKIKEELKGVGLYRELMQDFGDNLRSTGNPYYYPDKEWINSHKYDFQSNNYIIGRYIDYLVHYYSNAKQIHIFLVDSLRNPMCIKYLRNRYPKFFLVSLYASYEERVKRVEKQTFNFNKEDFFIQDLRDQGKDFVENYDGFYKQNVRESVYLSDIAVNNEEDFVYDLYNKIVRYKSEIFKKLLRYFALIVDPGCTKPTNEEMFMNMAFTMAMKSNCISRKVGAVIEGAKGYVVGAGWNDVGEGQLSCGLRYIKDLRLPEYVNCIEALKKKKGQPNTSDEEIIKGLIEKYSNENCCFCLKDDLSKSELLSKLDKIINSEKLKREKKKLYKKIKEKLNVKRLEFCKALHAEENAIIQSAKIGGMGLMDAKIYITTYPCELCAKKIQQSGIKEILYVEPYPKVLSEHLFLKDGIQKVSIKQFEGVKAYAYMKLFKPFFDQKERQKLIKDGFDQNVV